MWAAGWLTGRPPRSDSKFKTPEGLSTFLFSLLSVSSSLGYSSTLQQKNKICILLQKCHGLVRGWRSGQMVMFKTKAFDCKKFHPENKPCVCSELQRYTWSSSVYHVWNLTDEELNAVSITYIKNRYILFTKMSAVSIALAFALTQCDVMLKSDLEHTGYTR